MRLTSHLARFAASQEFLGKMDVFGQIDSQIDSFMKHHRKFAQSPNLKSRLL